jgi:hypothetical protein
MMACNKGETMHNEQNKNLIFSDIYSIVVPEDSDISVMDLPFSVRLKNVLMRNHVTTLSAILATNVAEFEGFRNLGAKTVKELNDYLNSLIKEESSVKSGENSSSIKSIVIAKNIEAFLNGDRSFLDDITADERKIAEGLSNFLGVKRRFEEIGVFQGVTYICDYAHHPREILSTVETAKKTFNSQVHVVFQPHTYSRTKLLMLDFVEVLRKIDNLVIYKTYPAREYFDELGSAKTLSENVGGCLYIENIRELNSWIKRSVRVGDAVLFLGAGDIYFVAQRMVNGLK